MSKTTQALLVGAAIIGVGVATGGISIAASGSAAGFLGGTLGGGVSLLGVTVSTTAIGSSLLAAGALSIAQGAAGALAKSPRPDNTSVALKSAITPRVSGYGRYKTFGSYVLYTVTADGFAVDAWAFHDGRIDAIEGYYLGEDKVSLTAGGFVMRGQDGRYGDNDTIQVGANLGAATETAHGPVVTRLPGIWTTAHRGDGVVSGFMISKPVKTANYQEVYATGGPNQTPLGLVIRAQPVFDWRDETQTVGDPLSWKWSENVWLHIAHYKLVREASGPTRPPSDPAYWSDIAAQYEARWNKLFAPTLAFWTTAANDADVPMGLKAGETEPRYRSCLSHKHTDDHKSVITALLACCDGWISPRADGALVPYSGRYYTPTVSIGPDDIAAYSFERGVEDENALNEIPVSYISDLHDFNVVDASTWTDETDIATRGQVRSNPLANQVPSHAQARRLAKRLMAQTMAPLRGTTTTLAGAGDRIVGQRYINQRLAEGPDFVLHDGPVEITGLSRNLQTGATTYSWRVVDINIDEWNAETEEGDPAPVGEQVAREPLDAPTIISATATYSAVGTNPDGEDPAGETVPGGTSTGARVLIAATGPDRVDLTWYARWRVGTVGSWNEREYPDADPGPGVTMTTEFVPVATNVNVQVAYSVGDGRQSPWSLSSVVDTTGG